MPDSRDRSLFEKALSRIAGFFSFPTLLVAVLLASPFFSSTDVWKGTPILRDPDIWWHMRNAETLLNTHHFITTDTYSFTTRGQRWIDPEWLAEIPYYLGFHLGGERGLFLVMLGAFECIVLGVLLLAFLRSRDFKAAYVATWITVLLAAINFGPRTVLFGWMCFIAEMLILHAFQKNRSYIWLLVPLFALWINLHGSWMIGLVFFVLYAASGLVEGSWGSISAQKWTPSQMRQLALVGLASATALFANPYGWRLVVYPFDMAFQQKLGVSIGEEWRSVNFHSTNGKIFFAVLAGLSILSLLRRRRWSLQELLFALLAVYSAFSYVRFLFLAGIVLCPIIADQIAALPSLMSGSKRNRPILNAALIALIWSIVFYHFPGNDMLQSGVETAFPSGAFRRLSTFDSQTRVFNAYSYGGYMIWNTRTIPVFIDSRTDIFEHRGVLRDYVSAIDIEDTLGVLDKYRIQYVFFPKEDPVVYLLEHTSEWKLNYDDGNAVILERARSL
jgi:hypothetical protein